MLHLSCFLSAATTLGGAQQLPAADPLTAELDRGRLAIQLPGVDDGGGRALELARAAGLDAHSAQRVTGDGWHLIELARPLASDEGANAHVALLAARGDCAMASPVLDGAADHWGLPTDELLLRLRADQRGAVAVPAGLELLESDFAGLDGVLRLRLPAADGSLVLAAARELARTERYEWVVPRLVFSGEGTGLPTDPGIGQQWAWSNSGQDLGGGPGLAGFDMNLEEVYAITGGDPSIGVLLIDVGVDDAHPDLAWTIGLDLGTTAVVGQPGSTQNPCDVHGTRVAGISSATTDNGAGMAGIVPGCELISVRAFESLPSCDGSWNTTIGNTALALAFGESNGARVTMNSNFYGFTDSALEAKYAQLEAAGQVHFGSAGNAASAGVAYPASLPTVIAAGATTNFGGSWGSTAVGAEVEFAAPGFNIRTTDVFGFPGAPGAYVFVEGTSYAVPHLAGVAAAMISIEPGLDQAAVRRIFRASATDLVSAGVNAYLGRDLVSGYGQPDALVAMEIVTGVRAGLASDGGVADLWLGGATELELFAHPPLAPGMLYVVLGSLSGTDPGLSFGGQSIPLNPDTYLDFTLGSAGAAPLLGGVGLLDAAGEGTATFAIPAGVLGPLEVEVHHAALVLDILTTFDFATGVSAARSSWLANTSVIAAQGLPVPIPGASPAGITSTLTVAGLGTNLSKINLITDIAHPDGDDVSLVLESPAGTRVQVWSADPFAVFEGLNGVWGDWFGTDEPLTNFVGEDPNGVWKLEVADSFPGQTGFLEGWSLALTTD